MIAIYFDKNRQVRRLANYGLQDGKIFDFISRTTPTSGQELELPDAAVQAARLLSVFRRGTPVRVRNASKCLRQVVSLPDASARSYARPQTTIQAGSEDVTRRLSRRRVLSGSRRRFRRAPILPRAEPWLPTGGPPKPSA